MKIEGYVVEMRHIDPNMLGQWHSLGSFPPDNHAKLGSGLLRFTVQHLLPHCGYQFRLRAYNKVGESDCKSSRSRYLLLPSLLYYIQCLCLRMDVSFILSSQCGSF